MGERLPEWQAAVNGSGRYPWFIQRKGADRGNWPGGSELWYLEDARRRLCRFKSYETANRRAQALNAAERLPCALCGWDAGLGKSHAMFAKGSTFCTPHDYRKGKARS